MKLISWQNIAASAILGLGLTQMLGDTIGSRPLKGLGAVSAAAPFPKVFCDVRGYEPFAAEFTLLCVSGSKECTPIPITPQLYRQLGGSYNRRNAYGAALSYAPRLPEPIWQSVAQYGLRPSGPLRQELGLPADAAHINIHIATRTRGRDEAWLLTPGCEP
jgi:hypothetical protein